MPLEIVRSNLARFHADAIVCPASPVPGAGGGIEAEIYRQAGPKLQKAREKVGPIAAGSAAVTNAYHLRADYVIHAVCPVWQGGSAGEAEALRHTYENALLLADQNKCQSAAFPLLAADENGFPKELALQIAMEAFRGFHMDHDMQLSTDRAKDLKRFIAEHYVRDQKPERRKREEELDEEKAKMQGGMAGAGCMPFFPSGEDIRWHGLRPYFGDLQKRVNKAKKNEDGFSPTLLHFIDRSGRTDPDVYKHANVDRRLFSKIRSNKGYNPSKEVVLAFAISLKLDLEDTQFLLASAGYALSPGSITDIVVTFCIQNHIYDIFEVNQLIYDNDGLLLGSVQVRERDDAPVEGRKRGRESDRM